MVISILAAFFLSDLVDNDAPLAILNSGLILIKKVLALLGSLVILMGAIYATCQFVTKMGSRSVRHQIFNFDVIRLDLGRAIILGLEFIIASDVIETTTTPDYYSVGILGLLVLIRTFLNYFLNKDLAALSQREQDHVNQ